MSDNRSLHGHDGDERSQASRGSAAGGSPGAGPTGFMLGAAARIAAWGAGAVSGARLTTLTFHRVLAAPDPMYPDSPDAWAFERYMTMVRDLFNVVPLDKAIVDLGRGTLPLRSAAITFDDGYRDNVTVALPILSALRLPATFFIATGFLNGGRMWNDTVIEALRVAEGDRLDLGPLGLGEYSIATDRERVQAAHAIIGRLKYHDPIRRAALAEELAGRVREPLPADLMMTDAQVRQLRDAGMTIGAHTVRHPILASVSDETAKREISDSKDALEGLLGESVSVFAYPNGKPGQDYTQVHVDLVKQAGFQGAVSTALGAAGKLADRFQLPRLTPWHIDDLAFRAQMIRNTLRSSFQIA